jgi:RNA polymerase sigma-70 factor, ECF subfamily
MGFKRNFRKVHEQDSGIELALNGDQEALGCVLASRMPQLYRAALRILGKPQDAEDALQDGLLSAVRHLEKFECRSRFSSWLTRIVINSALMRLRNSRREPLASIDQMFDRDEIALADRITDPRPNPEEIYLRQEQFQRLEKALQGMPAVYRRALWFRHVKGLKVREAAEAMGLATGTLKSQLHRARRWLGDQTVETGQTPEVLQSSQVWRS